jgi:AcrR family transcriptional regulator
MVISGHDETDSGSNRSVRHRLLYAAGELLCEHGFEATNVRDITARARCKVAAVNYHFGGERRLYVEMFRRHLAELLNGRVASLREVMSLREPTLQRLAKTMIETGLKPPAGRKPRSSLVLPIAREMLNPRLKVEMLLKEQIE